ncbi:hypothetical protein GC173_03485 [bacterium]|nr:hypothetical protein [bacterium]
MRRVDRRQFFDRLAAEEAEMLPEYDFARPDVVRGMTYQRLQEFRRRRLLAPDMAEQFPDDRSVDEALREYLRMKHQSA